MATAKLHRFAGFAPLVCSALALLDVAAVLLFGWDRHLPDEGTAAHIFQLLIGLEAPMIGLFLLTMRRDALATAAKTLAVQLAAAAVPLGLVYANGL